MTFRFIESSLMMIRAARPDHLLPKQGRAAATSLGSTRLLIRMIAPKQQCCS